MDEQARYERDQKPCPCGNADMSYGKCCKAYHSGEAKAKTAEQLMRSRYSAYYHRRVEYLVETTHPDTREPGLTKTLQKMIHTVSWQKLEILAISKGGVDDKVGKVEFIASYRHEGQPNQLHEVSRFKRYKGQWKYLDGSQS